jgi:hypothetical protein
VKKPRELAAFLKKRKGVKRISDASRRSLIYQLRSAGIIGGARTQAVLIPRERVERIAAKYAGRPEVRRVVAANPAACPRGFARSKAGKCVRRRRAASSARPNPLLATIGFNPKKGARRNPGRITMPFRAGQKIKPSVLRNWVAKLPNPPRDMLLKRFDQNMAQYRRFHQGRNPKFFTMNAIPFGASKQVTDVDFVTSEGKEWAATYQVPKHSGKYRKDVDGRYVHSHGESGVEATVAKPVKRKKLPERFHTAGGKFIGVIPSRNVRITDWYYG